MSQNTAPYIEQAGWIVGRNRAHYNNRPLYGDHRPCYVLAGDRPHVRLARTPHIYGCLTLAVARGDRARWLHEADEVVSRYRPGRMQWEIRDPAFAGLTVHWEVLPLPGADGLAAKVTVTGAQAGDQLIWAFGGAVPCANVSGQFDPVISSQKKQDPLLLEHRFRPEDCRGNQLRVEPERFVLTTSGPTVRHVVGRCTAGGLRLCDAAAWPEPAALFERPAAELPLACGRADLGRSPEMYWSVEALEEEPPAAAGAPAEAFASALARVEALAQRVVLETPEPRLDAGVAAAFYAVDALYYPPVYVHGAMAWNIPFPGWRSFYGATAGGWHEHVKAEARYYIASQNRDTAPRQPQANPARRLCVESPDSRFHGRGRILQDAGPYNFQSQFFDQLVHAWRWTADAELETLLREALELHLEWVDECFDPDGDGLYESYINTWPTDSVWYNGGGSAEESAYAFAGHRAAADLARRAGDEPAARRHAAQAEKIRVAVGDQLWLARKGYVAAYKEQGGLERVHEDSWLDSIFLPIETGLLDAERAAQALHYTEWGLERVAMPFGGSRCWLSNWVPAPWSVREMYPGDNYALALAYYRAGLADEGWEVLQGNYLESMYYGLVPGAAASGNAGTDFADIVSPFGRTIVEGLFGYQPDYPNGVVRLAPQFPSAWDHAAITTPDCALRFRASVGEQRWSVKLTRPAPVLLTAPVRAEEISSVEVNGQSAAWSAEPGFGRSLVQVQVPAGAGADVVIQFVPAPAAGADAVPLRTQVGGRVVLEVAPAILEEVRDPQGALADARQEPGRVVAQAAANPGHHLVLARVRVGTLPQWRRFKLQVADPAGEAAAAARVAPLPGGGETWSCCDLRDVFNGDIRAIYQQQYVSPRPATCSCRIGVDAYSPWTFAFWKSPLPAIDLANVPGLLDAQGQLRTPQGVPFAWPGEGRNIAFVSRWDNWPNEVSVPLGRTGEAVWFLLCGTTNPMQCRIANARLKLAYADGAVDEVDLVPPLNFWTLCSMGGADYNYARDAFALPAAPPPTVQLGANCRAILLGTPLRRGVALKQVALEALSQEVVIGLMGITVAAL